MKTLSYVMRKLSRKYKLGGAWGVFGEGEKWHRIEVVGHELAHGMVLGIDFEESDLPEAVGSTHDRIAHALGEAESDKLEIEACAVELLTFRKYGMPADATSLAVTAAKMMRTRKYMHDSKKVAEEIIKTSRKQHIREHARELHAWVEEQRV